MDAVTLYTTWPDAEAGKRCARILVEERLAACANLIPAVTSIYAWRGEIEEASEVALLFKTTASRAAAAQERIAELHPYETPCIVAWPIAETGSAPDYLQWIRRETA
jgi:periplasmic divalent cation tolerance protein